MRPLRKAARAALLARLDRAILLAAVRALSVSDGVCVLPEGATFEMVSATLARPDVRAAMLSENSPGGSIETFREELARQRKTAQASVREELRTFVTNARGWTIDLHSARPLLELNELNEIVPGTWQDDYR